MSQWQDWVGRTQKAEDRMTPGLLTRWRATLDSRLAADAVPQGLHWCLCPPDAPTAQLGEDGHPKREDSADSFLPPIPLERRMWAASALRFTAPIVADMAVERTSTIASITEKSGSSGQLVFVEIDHHWASGGAALLEERQTLVYRAAVAGVAGAAAPMAPGLGVPDFAGWDWRRDLTPSEPLLLRYSALTFNAHRIHYDRPYAVGVEGYRGIVVHGPLTASLLLNLAQEQLGANTLARFAFRGESPAFAGEALHLVGKQAGDVLTMAALGSDGRTVMRVEAGVA